MVIVAFDDQRFTLSKKDSHKTFDRELIDAGLLRIPFHDLRHSAASILLCMGVNIKVIQELLGHSDISITLRTYSHLLPSMQQEVVETWNDVFKEKDKSKDGGDESSGVLASH